MTTPENTPLAPWTSAGRTLSEPVLPPSHHPTLDDVPPWESYEEPILTDYAQEGAGTEVVPWTVVEEREETITVTTWSEPAFEPPYEAEVSTPATPGGDDLFPWDVPGDAQPAEAATLSPWDSFDRALHQSVSWTEPEPVAAAPAPPAAEPGPATDEHNIYTILAARLERFAEELRLQGHPAVSRALAGDRLEAAIAGLIAGYIAAARND
jgi:hypothetical protein